MGKRKRQRQQATAGFDPATLARAIAALRHMTDYGTFTRDDMCDVDDAARMLEGMAGLASYPRRWADLDTPPRPPKPTAMPAYMAGWDSGWQPTTLPWDYDDAA